MNKLSILLLTTILTACSLAPNFKLPDSANAKSFKEAKAELKQGVWKVPTPLAKQDKGQWWKVFNDSKLDELEKQAISANQSLKAAAARVEQSRAIVRANAASFLPDINLGGNAVRSKAADASTAGFS
ncbi:MAG: TolC family protein, partial [Pseudomonadota bacterium]